MDASSLIHDSHVLVAKTRYKETAKSCGSCALALWSNVLGSIENRIIFKISGIQTCQAKVHIPATWIFALSLVNTHRDSTIDQLSRLL